MQMPMHSHLANAGNRFKIIKEIGSGSFSKCLSALILKA